MTDTAPLLDVDTLRTYLDTDSGTVRAVDGVSFEVNRGETVCLVGESGSGKTLTCDTITGLVQPPASVSGEVRFEGRDLLGMADRERRRVRGNRISYVFQNSRAALDPVYPVGDQLIEAIRFHRDVGDDEARVRAAALLRTVGLSRPRDRLDDYPHEFSDGMCQRVAIAIALAAEPDLVIADEPTSALDVTVQSRIIDLLDDLRQRRDLALLLVTHDLRVVAALADRVVVLYGGTVVETGPVDQVYDRPAHPYTRQLFASFTSDGDRHEPSRAPIPITGCRFHRECPYVIEDCRADRPAVHPVDMSDTHRVACVHYGPDGDPTTVLSGDEEGADAGTDRDRTPGDLTEIDQRGVDGDSDGPSNTFRGESEE